MQRDIPVNFSLFYSPDSSLGEAVINFVACRSLVKLFEDLFTPTWFFLCDLYIFKALKIRRVMKLACKLHAFISICFLCIGFCLQCMKKMDYLSTTDICWILVFQNLPELTNPNSLVHFLSNMFGYVAIVVS